ncbi:hypothetical protein AMS68_005644 [Peltaster fructicola]|uniref:Uncharacterized protein n=1 Tax=Peltaster fructicola TaxID=286661 RepID=A0A6H0XZF1_9PEZI|nr:hypothetical protein AMS68_005644 [Peltaster fructicola]
MPKPSLKNPFARRKSSGNVLDLDSPTAEAPTQSTFRVIERPEKKDTIVFDGSDRLNRSSQVTRPFSSPLQQLRGKSVDDLTYHANGSVDTAASRKAASALKPARGSGGTTASGSSEFYQSSSASGRFSSSSTLPSSVEQENEDEELFAQKRPLPAAYQPKTITPIDEALPPPPSFSSRAQRAFSFGLRNKRPEVAAAPTQPIEPTPPPKPVPSHSPSRERALTTSSYASTAVPTRIETKPDLGTSDFGGDFGSMFDTVSKSPAASPHRTVCTAQVVIDISNNAQDTEPMFPPRSYTRQDSSNSSPGLRRESPWERRNSRDGLLASAATSPNLTNTASVFSNEPATGYSRTPKALPSRERASEDSEASTGSSDRTYELSDSQDTRTLPLAKSVTAPALTLPAETMAAFAADTQSWERDSSSATPKALPKAVDRTSTLFDDEPLFDASPSGPASRAKRPDVLQSQSDGAAPRRLTMAQFGILQKYSDKTDGDEGDSGNEDEDDDEIERAKKLTQQRRKQEANMAVYRQQMKKVTGGGPTNLPMRPGLDTRSSSANSLYVGGVPGAPPADLFQPRQTEDDDEDVPLGILQAHGFPSGSRPPTRPGDYRSPSVAGQRGSQALPPFARRLPQDPYFGAGLVNPTARESLAYGGGSVYGGASAPVSPGGLVGIIASEEQQRQARRGSPNPVTGTYNSMPLPPNMPNLDRSSSMGSLQVPGYPSQMQGMQGMPMMPMMPASNDAQLQEFMQMQMHFMQNMQAIVMQQQAQMQQQQQQQLPSPVGMPRPMSSAGNLLGVPGAGHDQGRAMSMMMPPGFNVGMASRPTSTLDPRMSTYTPSVNGLAGPGPGPGYQPSIAPSERSNVGMPTRYRPVQAEDGRTNSFTSSMTLNALSSQPTTMDARPMSQAGGERKSTIRIVDKPKSLPKLTGRQAAPDEDEEGGWADMVKKLTSKRTGRNSKSNGDRVALSELYPNVE